MPIEPTCTTVVLLLGDPLTVAEELPATLASADALGTRAEMLLVCDGLDWGQHPAVLGQLLLHPRPGLLRTRAIVDHPAPLVNLALEWLRTPYFHLLWPGVRADSETASCLLEALDRQPDASLVYAGEDFAASRAMIRTSALRAAGGLDPAPILQTHLELDLTTRLKAEGEIVAIAEVPAPEPRWPWADYPFRRAAPWPLAGVRRYLHTRRSVPLRAAA